MRKLLLILAALLLGTLSAFAQSTIKGQVVGEDGIPIEGLTVMIQGTAKGFVTYK